MRLAIQTLTPALVGAAMLWSLNAVAAVVSVLPSDVSWACIGNSGEGSRATTATMPRTVGESSSLELNGDRTRFTGLGNPFSPAGPRS
jgi:hypothetical protein